MRKLFFSLLLAASTISMYAADALSGEFSVSASKKVAFSKGNLQYQAAPTPTWRFATNQWDVVGNATAGNVYEGEVKCNNALIANDYTGWIDLFGWGTGDAPTKHTNDKSDYATFTDWGVNAISNGGNTPNMWYTLSADEWAYLINTRTDAANKKGQAAVGDIYGVVLLPDEWTLPSGLTFTPTPKDWTTNVYTTTEWGQMEANGAVFLPLAGGRYSGTAVQSQNEWGLYHSSTISTPGSTSARVFLSVQKINPGDAEGIQAGQSVRLVTKVPQKGDTIRYTYKGNTLYYLITARTGGSNNNVTIVKGGSTSWKEEEKPTGALVIPDTIEDVTGTVYDVTAMYESAFKDCDGITSVDFSENTHLTFVSRMAFYGCTALTSVTLSDYITYLSDYCFHGAQLTAIDLKNVQYICQYIFDYCNITEVHIPKSVRYIFDQNRLFDHAATITCDAENPYYAAIDNVLYNKEITMIYALPLAATHDIHIPATVTSMLYQCMYEYPGTIYINSQITPTWPLEAPGDNRNSPAGDVFVGCGLYEFYTTGRYEGTTGDFGKVKSLTEQLVYTVDVKAGEHGSVNINDTTACNQVTIIAIADAHYDFVKWSNGSTDQVILLEVVSDTAIVAEFALQKFNVTVVAENGSVTAKDMMEVPVDLSQPVEYGMKLYLTATPNEGYEFDSWTNYDPATGLTVTDNITVTATFKTKPTALDQITPNPSPLTAKRLINGQLFIQRGDELFNAQGARVE